jgi:hypothetical protein
MHRQGYDLQLMQYDERGWRATLTGGAAPPKFHGAGGRPWSSEDVADRAPRTLGGRLVALGAFLLLLPLSGCSFHATRFTWAPDNGAVGQAHATCIREINQQYVPVVAGKWVLPTLYKDCMERHGYTKVGTDEVPLIWEETPVRGWHPVPRTCGAPNQTCIWRPPA